MKLKKRVKSLDDVPEAFRSMYTKKGDEYVLDVEVEDEGGGGKEGDSDEVRELRRKLEEFRNTNVNLMKQRDAAQALADKYKDVDPEKYKEAMQALDTINAIEEKDLIKGGKFDEVVNRRLASAKGTWETEKRQLEKAKQVAEENSNKYRDSYAKLRVRQQFADVFGSIATIKPGAFDDVMSRVERAWQLNDKDELVAEGLFNDKAEPMQPEEFGKMLLKTAPHLFEPGQGGGATGGNKKPGQTGKQQQVLRPDEKGVLRFGKGKGDLNAVAEGKALVASAAHDDGMDDE